MKYISTLALAGTVIWLAGCASAPRVVVVEPIGPAPAGAAEAGGEGSLAIYSARALEVIDVNAEEWLSDYNFGGNENHYEPAHTDYTIYTQDGQFLQHVRNARGPGDQTPVLVMLPAGSYKVEAAALNCDSRRVGVLMFVVVKPGQATVAHLDGDWNPTEQSMPTALATLPCGRVIGWRAEEIGVASNQMMSRAN
jgi:hypothetical protein